MKKIILISIISTLALVMSSCGGGKSNSPTKAAEASSKALIEGDFQTIVDNMYFKSEGEEYSEKDIKDLKEEYIEFYKEIFDAAKEDFEGFESYEVYEEELSEDGEQATVKIKYQYKNGESWNTKPDYIKVDGKWLKLQIVY